MCSSSSVLPGTYESLPGPHAEEGTLEQTCFSKRRAYYIWTQSLPHGGGEKINLHRSGLVLQHTEKTKAFGLTSHYKKMCNKRPQLHCCHWQRMHAWTGIFQPRDLLIYLLFLCSCSLQFLLSFTLFFNSLLFLLLPSCHSSLYSMFAIHFPCSSTVIFVGVSLYLFLSHWLFCPSLCLICLCLVSHEQVCGQRVHTNYLSSSTEHTLVYKRSGVAQFWGWVHLDLCRSGQMISADD